MYSYPFELINKTDPMGLDVQENLLESLILDADVIPAKLTVHDSYKLGDDMVSKVGGIHIGAADALRHCYWMCRMTQDFGQIKTNLIGKNHEDPRNKKTETRGINGSC